MGDMTRIEQMFQQINETAQQTNGKIDSFVLEMKQIKDENLKLEEHIMKQEERIEKLEREIRKKNIVVMGISDEENEKESETEDKIMHKIGTSINKNVDIDEIKRLGNYSKDAKRPVLVKLTKESTRTKILKSAKNLKGTGVWIDYPKKIQEERRSLISKLKKARDKGYTSYIRHNKLIINKQVYQNIETSEDDENGSGSHKRTADQRSPAENNTGGNLRKITKITKAKK